MRPSATPIALLCAGVALAVRLAYAPRFYGWEEGDYGDLMMVREVLDSRLTWFRVAHMPMWYLLSALVRLIWSDARASALSLTMVASVATVFVLVQLCARLFGRAPALVVGLWMATQPESALYGASTLREPLYAFFAVLGADLLIRGATAGAGFASGFAFLTRMEAAFTWMPALLGSALGPLRRPRRAVLAALGIGLSAIVAWQAYITVVYDESAFFMAPLGVNFAPDVHGGDARQWGPWFDQGLRAASALLLWTLPRKIGWLWWVLLILGFVRIWRDGAPAARVLGLHAALGLALWLFEGFVAHHEPNHNLYWTWLLPIVPFLAAVAAFAFRSLLDAIPARPTLRYAVTALAVASVLPAHFAEARYQSDRASRWYRPQLDLARWMEDELPAGTGVLVSSIPECWLDRQHGPLRVHNWWQDIPSELRDREPAALGQWLVDKEIRYVLWFREDWTDAPSNAPYLAAGEPVDLGPVVLLPLDREDEYGWILFATERPGWPPVPKPPAYGRGELGRGWK